MKTILSFLLLVFTFGTFAQKSGDVVIFNNSGYQFYVVLNGVKQNSRAESNVRIQELTGGFYGCLVIADDNTFSLNKNIIVKSDTLITYQLTSRKGKFKLRFFSEVPMNTASKVEEQTVVTYHTEEIPVTTTTTTTTSSTSVSGGNSTSTTNTQSPSSTENVSISMSANENGINVNMNATGLEGGENVNIEMSGGETGENSTFEQTTTTTYTETTVTTTGSGSQANEQATTWEPGTPANCFISESEVDKSIALIKEETFADDQLRMAKALVTKKCLNVDQIGRIADILTFSDDRMELLKAAYQNCLDRNSYYQLLSKFTFSSDKEELQKYIDEN